MSISIRELEVVTGECKKLINQAIFKLKENTVLD